MRDAGARHRPCFLRRGVRRNLNSDCAFLEKTEGARNATGPGGPTHLDASRHRGLSKSIIASPPSPWRPARGVLGLLRSAPGGRAVSGCLRYRRRTYPPLRAQTAPGKSGHAGNHRQWGPVTRGRRAGTKRLGPPVGLNAPHLRRTPGHRSPPRVCETLIRHPSVTGQDARTISIG